MKVLLIGGGGREHAIARALARSPRLDTLFCAPGNPGIAEIAAIVRLDPARHDEVIAFCRRNAVSLVVVGPEAPLVAGLVDSLAAAGVRAFGPSAAAARVEGSKGFTKDLCRDVGIPTAGYARFSDLAAALAHVRSRAAPVVVKADGLAAGKGVTVAAHEAEAVEAVRACFAGGAAVVIEDFMDGEEASFFALVDGRTAMPFGTARDYKRAHEGDRGPNTGGMGAVSPAPALDEATAGRVMDTIVIPTIAALAARGTPYRGVLYAGLMLTAEGPKLIEYNARLGDPEAQALLPRLEDDLLLLMAGAADGDLSTQRARWGPQTALTVVLAARGYPGPVESGSEFRGLAAAAALPGVELFHAATRLEGDRLVAAGGRVLNVTARAGTVEAARRLAYAAVQRIDWPGGFWRQDIGLRAAEEAGRAGEGA